MNEFEKKEGRLASLIGKDGAIHKIKIGEFDINYAKFGSGNSPPLLMIHGANIGWGQWYPNIGEISKHFTVYALDLPGSGGSTKIDFRKLDLEKDFLKVVGEFIDRLGLKDFHIVGHSIGGWVAVKMALNGRFSIGKIVLVDPIGFSSSMPWRYRPIAFYPIARFVSGVVMKPTRDNMKKFLLSVLYEKNSLDEVFIDYFFESVIKEPITHPIMLIHSLSGLIKIKKELILLNELSGLKIPLLVISGDKDPLVSITKIKEGISKIPDAKIEIFYNTGHVPSIEKSKRFNKTVINFLNT